MKHYMRLKTLEGLNLTTWLSYYPYYVAESLECIHYRLSLLIFLEILPTNFPGCVLVVLNMIEGRFLGSHLHCLNLHFIWKIYQLQTYFAVQRSDMLYIKEYILSVGGADTLASISCSGLKLPRLSWFSGCLALAHPGLCLFLGLKSHANV